MKEGNENKPDAAADESRASAAPVMHKSCARASESTVAAANGCTAVASGDSQRRLAANGRPVTLPLPLPLDPEPEPEPEPESDPDPEPAEPDPEPAATAVRISVGRAVMPSSAATWHAVSA